MVKRLLIATLAAPLVLATQAQNYKKGNPSNSAYDYLKDYGNLKDYINYEKYPNFHLGVGTTASEYNKKGNVYRMTNDNFTETVAGNAMKMASCVSGNGSMNFSTVTAYVNNATAAGLNVYGHTLAWHSQQPIAWLSSLMKDHPAKVLKDGDVTVYQTLAEKNFTKEQSVGWHSDYAQFNYNITFDATNGMKVHTSKKANQNYEVQYIAMDNILTEKGGTVKMTMTIKGSAAGQLSAKLGDWGSGPSNNIKFTKEWQDVEVTYKSTIAGSFLLIQSGSFLGDIYIKNIKFEVPVKGKTMTNEDGTTWVYVPQPTPLTAEEVHDTLVYAMDKWIKGMMNACKGKVKAWDVVNEAISGGGNDGHGNYTLQHRQGYKAGSNTWDVGGNAFYWQDYMGDLEYVRQAVRLARKYGPEDIKLFINDYNLESDWDHNKKVKSLINWIKKWESDGETYIDGIGTQMHISYYENSGTQTSKKNAITTMFRLMAATGKLVRVSELDMGYVDKNGKDVPTNKMTETQHKNMANFYKWIIKQYLLIIPAAQQWGICQWCATDSPSNSGWRANTPVGWWDINYYRKHAYAGVCEGLGGVNITAIDDITSVSPAADAPEIIYDLQGRRVENPSHGIYIIGGKKVFIR